jgi:cysteine desulfurase
MIYLDNAATTPPIHPHALDGDAFFANPSSPHAMGIAAERALSTARKTLADILFCKPKEITFTSGGTEANNLAILGYALARRKANVPLAIFAEPWAHPSVLAPIRRAAEIKTATEHIATPRVNAFGEAAGIPVWDIPKTGAVLICLSHINHETGDVTDVTAISREIKKMNPHAVLLVDGAQGFCKDINATETYKAADMYTFSGHKIHAPTGTGGLLVRGGIKLAPLLYGGGQENDLRPGTENAAGIVRMAHAALYQHGNLHGLYNQVKALRDSLADMIQEIPGAVVNTLRKNACAESSPFILNISFPGTKGEVLVHMLSERGICVSTGAACKARKRDKSTLAHMGFPREIIESAIRVSFSHLNTPDEILKTRSALAACVAQLRKIKGYK